MENPFSLKGKTTGQISNNFTIIKSITIILVYASRLKKKKILSYFSLLQHTQIIFLKGDNLFSLFFNMLHPISFSFHYAAPPFFTSNTYLLYI